MLRRIAPSLFQAGVGETVTIAAKAENNSGVESVTYRYGSQVLETRLVDGRPGCDFVAEHGTRTFGAVVLFSNAPNARYDLFEEDDLGNLTDLSFPIEAAFGPVAQFQVEGIPVAVLAAAKKAKPPKKTRASKRKPAKAKRTTTAKNAHGKKSAKPATRAKRSTAKRPRRRTGR